jgi:hypothetical protein
VYFVWVFNRTPYYRDKKLSGVFVRFRAPLHTNYTVQNNQPATDPNCNFKEHWHQMLRRCKKMDFELGKIVENPVSVFTFRSLILELKI